MRSFNAGWYLIYTKPCQERKVAEQVGQKMITSFLPAVTVERQWHDRKKQMLSLLFPSYVFVYLKSVAEFFSVLELNSVSCYVKMNKQPVIVAQSVIDQIRLIVDKGRNVSATAEHFAPGQGILIQKGSLNGLAGEVVQYQGREKILVRVMLLNRNIILDLPASCLTAKV